MAVGGRKPKPTELRILEGNKEHRPIKKNPKFKPVCPKPPKWMDKEAKLEWRRLAKILFSKGLLTEVDLSMFQAYCIWYGKFIDAAKKIKHDVFETDSGYQASNPLISVANKYFDNMRKIATEFGMTPSSRSRLDIKDFDEVEDWGDLLD